METYANLVQIIPAQENMFLLSEGVDEDGPWTIEEKIISLGLQDDESIMLIIVDTDGHIGYIDADREMLNSKIIFK